MLGNAQTAGIEIAIGDIHDYPVEQYLGDTLHEELSPGHDDKAIKATAHMENFSLPTQ
jgi:hypothetical protein